MKTAVFLPLMLLRSSLKGCDLFLLTEFITVNVHKMSDKWSYDTFAHSWSAPFFFDNIILFPVPGFTLF
jgi:hypothetical protein